MSDAEPIEFRPRHEGSVGGSGGSNGSGGPLLPVVAFNRGELNQILRTYGRMVAAGEWRDYAMDFTRDRAVFSIFRRTSEFPLYRIVKDPKLARKQGAYSIVTATGLILKRGQSLERVLALFDNKLELVGAGR